VDAREIFEENMMKAVMKTLASVGVTCALAAGSTATLAASATWPTKPVRVVVPFSPGGGTDSIARALGQKLTETFGQQFIVDNRAGAGGTIGAELVARANPDGYTLSMVSASYAANPALYKLPYDPVKGITPISLLAVGPLVLVGNPGVKANSIKDLIAISRAKPNSLTYGSTGVGSLAHLCGALFTQMTGAEMLHVPYKGVAPALIDMIAGNLQLGYYTAVAVVPHMKAGRLRAFGITTEKRVDALPGVPTIGEFVPGYAAEHWYGLWGPKGLPTELVARLNQAVGKALDAPEMRDRIVADGFVPTHTTPEEFGKRLARDVTRWQEVVKRGNIKVDVHG
jgi:tripartite-type tricarboxylate transporter receptor subunit TctC